MKTFMRWNGNKFKYIHHIAKYIPEFDRYIEPFVGSGALLLWLQPKSWIINDSNKDAINVWKSVRDSLKEMLLLISKFGNQFIKLKKEDKIAICKSYTAKIPSIPYNVQRATLFIIMKFCAYMGNIVVKNKFYFNGFELSLHNATLPYFTSLRYFKLLQKVSAFLNSGKGKIYNKDYRFVLSKAIRGDFVFLDPPYIEKHDYKFNYNIGESLNNSFLNELLEEVKKLDRKGVKWLMTQADTADVKSAFRGYKIIKFPVYRAYSNTRKYELIIKNY